MQAGSAPISRRCGQDHSRRAADTCPSLVDLQVITAIARAYEQGKDISAEDLQTLAGGRRRAP